MVLLELLVVCFVRCLLLEKEAAEGSPPLLDMGKLPLGKEKFESGGGRSTSASVRQNIV